MHKVQSFSPLILNYTFYACRKYGFCLTQRTNIFSLFCFLQKNAFGSSLNAVTLLVFKQRLDSMRETLQPNTSNPFISSTKGA